MCGASTISRTNAGRRHQPPACARRTVRSVCPLAKSEPLGPSASCAAGEGEESSCDVASSGLVYGTYHDAVQESVILIIVRRPDACPWRSLRFEPYAEYVRARKSSETARPPRIGRTRESGSARRGPEPSCCRRESRSRVRGGEETTNGLSTFPDEIMRMRGRAETASSPSNLWSGHQR